MTDIVECELLGPQTVCMGVILRAEIKRLRGHKEEADRHIATIAKLRVEIEQLRAVICDALDDEVARRMMSQWCAEAITAIGYDPAPKDTTP
jgi:hypothetical protein